MAATTCFNYGSPISTNVQQKQKPPRKRDMVMMRLRESYGYGKDKTSKRFEDMKCGVGIADFIGGDLLRPDLGRWLSDVEEHKSLAIYTPHEGGYEGRYFTRLRYQGYYFLNLSARGLGDPETTLTKVHPVCPVRYTRHSASSFFYNCLFKDLLPDVRCFDSPVFTLFDLNNYAIGFFVVEK